MEKKTTVCSHGSLARQCRVCELEQEVARLNDALLRASPKYTVWCGCGDEIIDDGGARCGACVSFNASKMNMLQQDNAILRAALARWNKGHMQLLEEAHNERDAAEARAEQADATIATLRAELQAAQAVAPLPKGWSESHGKGWWECEHSASGVILHADAVGPAIYTREGCDLHFAPVNQLITVLRHAQAAHARLRDGMPTPTPAQEGQ